MVTVNVHVGLYAKSKWKLEVSDSGKLLCAEEWRGSLRLPGSFYYKRSSLLNQTELLRQRFPRLCACLSLKHSSKNDVAISKNTLSGNIVSLTVNPFLWETGDFQSYWQQGLIPPIGVTLPSSYSLSFLLKVFPRHPKIVPQGTWEPHWLLELLCSHLANTGTVRATSWYHSKFFQREDRRLVSGFGNIMSNCRAVLVAGGCQG